MPLHVQPVRRLGGKERPPADRDGAAGLSLALQQLIEARTRDDGRLDRHRQLQLEESEAVLGRRPRLEILMDDDALDLCRRGLLQIGAAVENSDLAGPQGRAALAIVDGAIGLGDEPVGLQQDAAAVLAPPALVREALDGDDARIQPLRRLELRGQPQRGLLVALQSSLGETRMGEGGAGEQSSRECPAEPDRIVRSHLSPAATPSAPAC